VPLAIGSNELFSPLGPSGRSKPPHLRLVTGHMAATGGEIAALPFRRETSEPSP
jgi:ABC-type nitrate/sulfonate/bicarbonate transport system ATPase subunit